MAKDKLRYITDQAATQDDFGTHKNIATTLLDTIADEDNKPMTIGLEGSWGSGKSTVVNLMFKDIDNAKNISEEEKTKETDPERKRRERLENIEYFYIDVWQHEHSCIKRAILHEMIESLTDKKDKKNTKQFHDIKNKIKGTYSTSNFTALTLLFLSLTILTPFSTTVGLKLYEAEDYYWAFAACLPVISLLIIIFNLLNKTFRKDFYGEKSDDLTLAEQVTTTFSNSSIEFKEYFDQILSMIDKKKTLIVFDNLDRIDEENAKKMWAELQVFMQYRNPGATEEEKEERPWIIIPYDIDGIRKIWGEDEKVKSFLQKTFQIRVHVPKPTYTSLKYFGSMINKKRAEAENVNIKFHTPEFDSVFDDGLFTDFVNIYNSLNKDRILTPREVIAFRNQVHFNFDLVKYIDTTIEKEALYFVAMQDSLFNISQTTSQNIDANKSRYFQTIIKYFGLSRTKKNYDIDISVTAIENGIPIANAYEVNLLNILSYYPVDKTLLEINQIEELTKNNKEISFVNSGTRLINAEKNSRNIFWILYKALLSRYNSGNEVAPIGHVYIIKALINDDNRSNIEQVLEQLQFIFESDSFRTVISQIHTPYLDYIELGVKILDNTEKIGPYLSPIVENYGDLFVNYTNYDKETKEAIEAQIPTIFKILKLLKEHGTLKKIPINIRQLQHFIDACYTQKMPITKYFKVEPGSIRVISNVSDIDGNNNVIEHKSLLNALIFTAKSILTDKLDSDAIFDYFNQAAKIYNSSEYTWNLEYISFSNLTRKLMNEINKKNKIEACADYLAIIENKEELTLDGFYNIAKIHRKNFELFMKVYSIDVVDFVSSDLYLSNKLVSELAQDSTNVIEYLIQNCEIPNNSMLIILNNHLERMQDQDYTNVNPILLLSDLIRYNDEHHIFETKQLRQILEHKRIIHVLTLNFNGFNDGTNRNYQDLVSIISKKIKSLINSDNYTVPDNLSEKEAEQIKILSMQKKLRP